MTGLTPRSFGFLLLSVLLGHWLGLAWLRDQVPDNEPLRVMADPLFTRIIEPARPTPPVRQPRTRARRATLPAQVTSTALTDAEPVAPFAAGQADMQAPGELAQPVADAPDLAASEAVQGEAQAVESGPSAAVSEVPVSDSWPSDPRLSYRLKGYYRGDIDGSARVQWQREQNRYQVRVDLSMALVVRVSMISQGELGATSLLPSVYQEQFPWSLQGVTFEADAVRFANGTQLSRPPALQDTDSQFDELSHRFSSGSDALKVGGQVSVWLARPQGMALWTYDVIEEEMLQLAELGSVSAFHLRPRPIANPTGVITAEIWFAPSLQYLPVRVRISLGAGNFVDLLVERIEQGTAPATQTGDQRVQP